VVQNDEFGVLQQAAGDFDALTLARRKGPYLAVGVERHAVALRHLVNASAQGRNGRVGRQDEGDVLGHGEIVEQGEMLEHHAHALGARLLRTVEPHDLPAKGDLSFGGLQQAIDDLDQCRLARAILADQRMSLALVNVEADLVIGGEGAESLHDTAQRQQGR